MDAKKAKEMLEPIPSEQVILGHFAKGNGKCCAIGHLVRLTLKPEFENNATCSDVPYDHRGESDEVLEKVREIHNFCRNEVRYFLEQEKGVPGYDLADVNNCSSVNGYTQTEPKARVMDLLNDMIAAGY